MAQAPMLPAQQHSATQIGCQPPRLGTDLTKLRNQLILIRKFQPFPSLRPPARVIAVALLLRSQQSGGRAVANGCQPVESCWLNWLAL